MASAHFTRALPQNIPHFRLQVGITHEYVIILEDGVFHFWGKSSVQQHVILRPRGGRKIPEASFLNHLDRDFSPFHGSK